MRILERLLYWVAPVVLLFPLFVSKSFLYPFVSTKGFFIYFSIEFLFVVFALYNLKKEDGLRSVSKNKTLWLLGLFLLSKLIIDIFGLNFFNSFFGNYERMAGLYMWIHLFFWLIVLITVFNTKEKYRKLFDSSVFVGIIVAVLGLLQKMGLYFLFILPGDQRIYSSVGNPAYLASYLLANLFFAGYLFFQKGGKFWKTYYIIAGILDFFVIYLTATRGALLGLSVSVVFILIYFLIKVDNKKNRLILGSILLLLFLSVTSVFVFKENKIIQNNLTLKRVSEISFSDYSSNSRLLLWRGAIIASKDRLLFGYGENNIKFPLDKYYDPRTTEDWFDSSHNQFLDVLLSNGMIGLIVYLLFFGWIIFILWKKRDKDEKISIIFISFLVAYLINLFFLFDNLFTFIPFLLFYGWLIIDSDQKCYSFKVNNFLKKFLLSGGLLIVIFCFYINVRSVGVMVDVVKYSKSLKENAAVSIIGLFETEKKVFFGSDNIVAKIYSLTAESLMNRGGLSEKQLKDLIATSEMYTRLALEKNGENSYLYLNMGKIYQLGSYLDSSYLGEAEVFLNKAKDISPNRIDIYFALGQGYFLSGDIKRAESIISEALRFDVRQGLIYTNLSEVQIRSDNPENAIISLQKADSYGSPPNRDRLEKYAQIMVKKEKWEDLLDILFWMDRLFPQDLNIYNNILLTYKKIGNEDEIGVWSERIDNLQK